MPWFVSDRILWTTVAVGAVAAYYYVPSHLAHVAKITIVPEVPDSGPNKQLRTDAEQAISHDTLRVLSDGYSYDIRAATIKIVANRTLTSRTKQLILRDLASKDGTKRWNAICALRLLFYDQNLSDRSYVSHFGNYRSLKAVITALQNLLESHNPSADSDAKDQPTLAPSPVQPQYRPAHEDLLLPILRDILTLSSLQPGTTSSDILNLALRAGLVSKWLTRYPFPCALPENHRFGFQKSDVCRLMNGGIGDEPPWASDDPIMAFIIQHILDFTQGVEALREAGLLSADRGGENSSAPGRDGRQYTINDVRMVNGESTAGALTPPEMRELLDSARDDYDWRSPPISSNLGPESVRRRNRQAIVVAEAGLPLRRENILQRHDSESIADAGELHNIRGSLRINYATRHQAEPHEQTIDLSEPIVIPDQPWDLRRQEIEGEAIVNESIREAASTSRASRISSIDRSNTDGDLTETGQNS